MSKAYIIGTGPGNEELLTLKAVEVLKKCTAVLYDRLVSNNILNYLSEDCEIYYCGKEPGCHYKTQEEINEMLVSLAKKGHIVGRIKGGDPYVFGRGGEEVLALVEENIEFEVVPGVTSPISVLNYAGIPITQRGMAQSFHIVTGMTAGVLNINWEALAKEKGTLVFMMGLSNLDKIVENLILNGKDKTTKTAVVMRGTSSKQKKVIGTLEDIEEKVKKAKLKSPCIIVVGEVVELNEKLSWYEEKPLFGVNICVTRSRKQASNLKNKLRELGAEVTEINSIKIEGTKENLAPYVDNLDKYHHIILTSVNGVNMFFDYLIEKKYDIRNIKAKFSVVGKATRKALQKRGIVEFIMAREFVGEGLFKALSPYLQKGEKVLIPCSSASREYLKDEIEKLGLEVHRVNTYDTKCGDVKNTRAFEEVDFVLYTSPSTVKNMISMFGEDKIKEKRNISIGPQTSKALNERNIDNYMCKKHSEDGFLEEIVNIYKSLKES
ncbi:uroporphyrinogen-III C-methyltransferase [Clostridium chauvoei]|uniref:uroporphyrinogen-III C-methyltransferase n=2 Tax=Clostridium chauvoei TaxID=46867 RepID=S6EIV5_9CLOT|nr:uroporphyrinogen-III C-methyltransferase [Clostridium chauvoei]ATD54530.1 uroporphyrinogen-III C-methyltransferase [Clostridium chauvoei]ATD57788.1 uroporphyrinogen-III C-methyltransferase [Clostridium chauvoei]MBX7281081.1 uroporphyrinogen-III C-methyltransferase [Clostridium chauvoei]MBX7283532.1 uroporphyrinogen-III C-methyltransferase [Clostridium chauvoei]MBX7286054.1 uroporphyrinogen-III C-methyltransferase [Clostridium chauvoei]